MVSPEPRAHPGSGQGLVEYSLILAFVALLIILVLIVIGNQVLNMWSQVPGAF